MNPESLLNSPSGNKWRLSGTQKRSGVLVPLFSVYSRKSMGVGDFFDLKLLIDWASVTGNSIIQLLPMNEMGSFFCPYDAISAFALEPMYAAMEGFALLGTKADFSARSLLREKINKAKKKFPAGETHLGFGIKKEKMDILREVFGISSSANDNEFLAFKQANAYWLKDFSLYKALKELHGGSPWYEWREEYRYRDRYALEVFEKEHAEELAFQSWLQWQLFRQFKEAKDYAASKKVLLKGDLPILVSRDSADVWQHAEFFKLDFASGAPPDMYAALGQRWGMPTYNWQQIQADGFRYIIEKFRYAENFYDLIRVDHVVGIFRIWSIPYNEPEENKGLNGFFDPSDEKEWGSHGRDILKAMLDNTKMLLCAEDLGVIPKACTDTLKELAIPGNDVQRWMKDWNVRHDFLSPDGYRELAVSMLSTHDTTNWPAWWENEAGTVDGPLFIRKCAERGIDYSRVYPELFDPLLSRHGRLRWLNSVDSVDKFVAILGKPREELADFIDMYENTFREKEKFWAQAAVTGAMREKCDRRLLKEALKVSLTSSSIFCVNTIIDWLYLSDIIKGDPYEFRINTPGTISNKNWSLTIPIPLEELLEHPVNSQIRSLIVESGRA